MITSQITIGWGMRPCAPCGTYVPATGCAHWKGAAARKRAAEVQKARRARHRAELETARERARAQATAKG